jgi:hypothetical protein
VLAGESKWARTANAARDDTLTVTAKDIFGG